MDVAAAQLARGWLREIIDRWSDEVLAAWTTQQRGLLPAGQQADERLLADEARRVLAALSEALDSDLPVDRLASDHPRLSGVLVDLSRERAADSAGPAHTALSVLALKQALVDVLRARARGADRDPADVLEVVVLLNRCVDAAAVLILETQLRERDQIITGHQQQLMELSAPLLGIAPGVLVLPLVGTLDAARAQRAMDNVLDKVSAERAHTVIIDLTGAVLADPAVVQHLLSITEAATLLGARCLVCGMRPDTAQALATLGQHLHHLRAYRTLAEAWAAAAAPSGPAAR